jgi:dihydroorotase
VELLREKRELALKKSVVNFGFHFGSSAGNLGEIKKADGIASVKIFMDATTGDMLIDDKETVGRIMAASPRCSVHAEGDSIRAALELAKSSDRQLYLCHLSLESELDVVRGYKGTGVFAEVTPHHLFLTDRDAGSFIRMKPSLKRDSDRRALWEALASGVIDSIGTDHAPHTVEEKESGSPPYGVPGVETKLPLMLDSVNQRRLTLPRLVQLVCENPAKIFKLVNKGFIREGHDADLTLVDMKLSKKVRNDELFTKCGWSPFDGLELKGWPVMTLVNGEVVFEDGSVDDGVRGKEAGYGD